MSKAIFDIAGKLDLLFRIARVGSKTFTFVDSNGDAYSLSGLTFQLNIKQRPSSTTNLFQLTSGSGLTIGASSIEIDVTELQTDLPEVLCYWELYETVGKKTWLCGSANFISRDPSSENDATTVTVNLDPDTVTVTISNPASSGTGARFRGAWSTLDTLPSSDLTAGDFWNLTLDSTMDAGDGAGSRLVQGGAILIFLSTGLWRFIE
jgi:hypothetical protein